MNQLIPTVKDDQVAIEHLKAASEAQVLAVADELLEWLQDGNWPVSLAIGKILSQHIDKLAPKVVAILRSNDSAWKYTCIRFMVMQLPLPQIPAAIITELNRIVLYPTANDVAEEAVEAAAEVLSEDY
jgi:hypothetical protein